MKLLVLGANSLLGRSLVGLLLEQGVEHDVLNSGSIDLLQKKDVINALSRFRPTQVINVATYSNLIKAEYDEAAAAECDIVNSRGVSILAEVCQQLNLPLIHHSSSFVFDGLKTHPYNEDDATNPVSRYGQSKWYGERAVRDALPAHIILRTDWIFTRERPGFFIKHIEECKKLKGRIELVNHRFSATPAPDVARVILGIATQINCAAEVWGTYHYCALQPMSQEHFVESFLQEAARHDDVLAQYADKLEITKLPVQLPYIPNTVLNTQRLFETFGIKQRSRSSEIAAILQDLYQLQREPEAPEPITPDKGDIADREGDGKPVSAQPKPEAVVKPAKKAAKKKVSRPPESNV